MLLVVKMLYLYITKTLKTRKRFLSFSFLFGVLLFFFLNAIVNVFQYVQSIYIGENPFGFYPLGLNDVPSDQFSSVEWLFPGGIIVDI